MVTVALLLTACPSPDSDSRGDPGDAATTPPTNQTGAVETAPPDNDRRSDASRMPWEGLCAALREAEAAITTIIDTTILKDIEFIDNIKINKIIGHTISMGIGIGVLKLLGPTPLGISAAMMAGRVTNWGVSEVLNNKCYEKI